MPRSFSGGGFRPRPDPKLFAVHYQPEKQIKDATDPDQDLQDPKNLQELGDWINDLLENDAADLVEKMVDKQEAKVEGSLQIPEGAPIKEAWNPLIQLSKMWGQPLPGVRPPCLLTGAGAVIETGVALPNPAAAPPPMQSAKAVSEKQDSNSSSTVTFDWFELERPPVAIEQPTADNPVPMPVEQAAMAITKRPGESFRMSVTNTTPFLYWGQQRVWMWHRKWMLPGLRVDVADLSTADAGAGGAGGPRPLWVQVTAGTLDETMETLENAGLNGKCQQKLELDAHGRGSVFFSQLLFRHTSFNCGGKPFHLVVTLLTEPPPAAEQGPSGAEEAMATEEAAVVVEADAGEALLPMPTEEAGGEPMDMDTEMVDATPEGEAAAAPEVAVATTPMPLATTTTVPVAAMVAAPLVPLMCLRSNPIRIDARRKGQGECAHAPRDDVRFLQRQQASASLQAIKDKQAAAQVPPAQQQPQVQLPQGVPPLQGGALSMQTMPTPGAPSNGAAAAPQLNHPDSPDDAIFEVGFDSVVLGCISSCAFGYTPQQLTGQSLLSITVPAQRPQLQNAFDTMRISAMISASPSVRIVHHVLVGLGNPNRRPEVVAVSSRVTLVNGQSKHPKLLVRSRHAIGAERLGGFQMLLN